MKCTSRSEYRFTGLLESAAIVDVPVVNDGVWHSAQPMLLNSCLPFEIDVAPPGVVVEGVGGASKRMNNANFSMSVVASSAVVASMLVVSLGVVANWQFAVSSRSVWKMSFVMPISTLYASAENSISDLFCAFQPNRAIVPSLPLLFVCPEIARPLTLKFGRPLMPRFAFWFEFDAWFAAIAASGICSIRPPPNVGVGIRKMMLLFADCAAKGGWASVQPVAPVRPVIVKIACTPPSGVPSGFLTKRTSRTGPFAERNAGTISVPPSRLANATCGFVAGELPPTAGAAWQPPQLSRFILGPRPSGTSSAVLKAVWPALKNAVCPALRPGSGLPAPAAPP